MSSGRSVSPSRRHLPTFRVVVTLALTVSVVAALSACSTIGSVAAQDVEPHTFTVDSTAKPIVMVDTFNGRVTVNSGGEGKVEARVTRRGSGTSQSAAEADLANVQVTFDQQVERITITARRADRPLSLGDSGADVEVTVPSSSSVELRTSNGRVEAANVTGSIIARTSNGPIVTRGGHDLDLDTSNGPVTVNGASGPLTVRTSNGAVDIVSVTDAVVTAQTSNATLSFSGKPAPGASVFRTSNGSLSLSLPGDTVFSITGATSNAAVRTDFPLQVTNNQISGAVGTNPLITIRADTSNGDLSVMTQKP